MLIKFVCVHNDIGWKGETYCKREREMKWKEGERKERKRERE